MKAWYQPHQFFLKYLLWPLSCLFRFVVFIRRCFYRYGVFKVHRFPVPVVIIGNISVGGTGKTPLLIALAHYFKSLGYQVGIVSRGYGGRQTSPHLVNPTDDPLQVGDEAILLARNTQCPVVVARDRVAAVSCVLAALSPGPSPASGRGEKKDEGSSFPSPASGRGEKKDGGSSFLSPASGRGEKKDEGSSSLSTAGGRGERRTDSILFPSPISCGRGARGEGSHFLILSDDGLQHYALHRDIEIAVIDGQRQFGNGACLPAGPLREPQSRLKTVDFVVVNGPAHRRSDYSFTLRPGVVQSLTGEHTLRPANCQGKIIHAIAGIGHTQRFFESLRGMGFSFQEHSFPDHHAFTAEEIAFPGADIIIMTEKDAVKCKGFADSRHFYLPITAECQPDFLNVLTAKLRSLL